jgi:hypothetical protein
LTRRQLSRPFVFAIAAEVREAARSELFELWRRVHPVLLREFDRQEPTFAIAVAASPGAPATVPATPAAEVETPARP